MDVLGSIKWNRVWRAQSKSAADAANKTLRQKLLAFAGASVMRGADGRFTSIKMPKGDSKLGQWFRSIRDKRTQAELARSWSPMTAPVIGKLSETPWLVIEAKATEADRIDLDDQSIDDIVDAIADSLTEDTEWLGPIVNDAINPGSFYDYGSV